MNRTRGQRVGRRDARSRGRRSHRAVGLLLLSVVAGGCTAQAESHLVPTPSSGASEAERNPAISIPSISGLPVGWYETDRGFRSSAICEHHDFYGFFPELQHQDFSDPTGQIIVRISRHAQARDEASQGVADYMRYWISSCDGRREIVTMPGATLSSGRSIPPSTYDVNWTVGQVSLGQTVGFDLAAYNIVESSTHRDRLTSSSNSRIVAVVDLATSGVWLFIAEGTPWESQDPDLTSLVGSLQIVLNASTLNS